MNLGSEHLGPYEMTDTPDTYERPAPYCYGEGHLWEKDSDGWDVIVEVCRDCGRTDLNHWRGRGLGPEWDL